MADRRCPVRAGRRRRGDLLLGIRARAVGGAEGGVVSVPAFADGRVVVATADGRIAALDSGTGAVHWQRTVAGKIPGSPHLVDGHIFVSVLANSYPDVYALDRPPVRSNG